MHSHDIFLHIYLTPPDEPKPAVSRWTLTQSCWCLLGVYLGLRFGDNIYMLHCPSKQYYSAAKESDNASSPTPPSADKEPPTIKIQVKKLDLHKIIC